jgi:hypothetical protein
MIGGIPDADETVGAALALLDHVSADDLERASEHVAEATQQLVQLRDKLIDRYRADASDAASRDALGKINAILSSVIAAEFPVCGFHRGRIDDACDALRELLSSREPTRA